jgi:PST family polysaccharide transporter
MTVEEKPLNRLVRDALGWSFLNNLVGRLGTLLAGIVLARLLTPHDYGVFAVALVALTAVLSMNELGVSLALVRWPGDVARIAPTVTTLAWTGSALCYAACFAAAPRFADALGSPEATGVVRLLCLGVLLDGITSVPVALLARSFQQGRRTFGDLTNFAVSTTVAVVLAINGFGAWSLAWSRLAGNLVSAVLFLLLADARHLPGFDRREATNLLRFGLPLAGSSLLVFAMLNVDYMIVGRTLGALPLGLYLLAFNLASWPVNMFSVVVRRVSLAAFARLQADPPALRAAFVRSTGLLMAVTVPAAALLSAFALPLIRVVYGERWSAAAVALRFLAIQGGVRVVVELAYDYLVAAGRTRTILWLQAGWLLSLIPALLTGAALGGIRGVAIGHAVVAVGIVAPAFALSVWRTGMDMRPVAATLVRPVAGAALVVATGLVAPHLLRSDALVVVAGGAVAVLLYGLVVAPVRAMRGAMTAAQGGADSSRTARPATSPTRR